MKPTWLIAGLLTGLLFAILAVPLGATTAPDSRAGRGFGPAYDAVHETILSGTIQEVVTRHELGSPAGMHLLVAGPQGTIDTHLRTGTPVRIVGAMLSLHGKEYFLARQLTVDGHTVIIRSPRGIIVPCHGARAAKSRRTAKVETNGGTR